MLQTRLIKNIFTSLIALSQSPSLNLKEFSTPRINFFKFREERSSVPHVRPKVHSSTGITSRFGYLEDSLLSLWASPEVQNIC